MRPEGLRNDFGAGLPSPSLLGGLEEFLEFLPSRASNSATRPDPTRQHRDQRIALRQRHIPLSEQQQQLLQRRSLGNR